MLRFIYRCGKIAEIVDISTDIYIEVLFVNKKIKSFIFKKISFLKMGITVSRQTAFVSMPESSLKSGRVGIRDSRWYIFKLNNPNLGTFWRTLKWKILVYFLGISNILQPFGMFYSHLVCFIAIWYVLQPFGIFCSHFIYSMVIWYIFPRFGMFHQEKSGNPGRHVYKL
jgi:hypothetical protein